MYTGDRHGTRQFQTAMNRVMSEGMGRVTMGTRLAKPGKNFWHVGNNGFKIKYIL